MTELTTQQQHLRNLAIAALLREPTIVAAARSAGLGEKTLRRWLHEPEFAAAYAKASRHALDATIGGLRGATQEALETLVRNLRPPTPHAVQVRAAVGIVSLAMKSTEFLELADKVDAFERRLAELDPAPCAD